MLIEIKEFKIFLEHRHCAQGPMPTTCRKAPSNRRNSRPRTEQAKHRRPAADTESPVPALIIMDDYRQNGATSRP
ncbi:hypothetical protein [Paracoccus luteus]|uniref:hypothetical protein n=1 Tax=Paracoccus luteus TaxID=2508543 RepID=UPI00142FAB4E|nr:hypothetical protein [Paracoccus luteus]